MHWADRTELPARQLLSWVGLGTSKFHDWKHRYDKVNEHNGKVPRDWWLEDWEKLAIVDFHDRHPLEGYRRLTFMMLDDDVVAMSRQSSSGRRSGIQEKSRGSSVTMARSSLPGISRSSSD
jgi:putative transposase